MPAYPYPKHDFVPAPEQSGASRRYPVAIVGAGPVGLTAALELAAYGVPSVVFKDGDCVSEGSRAICWAKRSLEILDRHGVARRILDKGYTWNTGRLFHGARELYEFQLQPQGPQKFPAFSNLQQYFAEEFLLDAAGRHDGIDLRWQSKVVDVTPRERDVELEIETPAGRYRAHADYVIAADGARSTVRRRLGLGFSGRVFEDHFLIADVDVQADLPDADRRFWFAPHFGGGDTALCHKQGDNMWRVDFQLGPDIDIETEKQPSRVLPRIRAMLGDHPMQLGWVSIYTFQARRLERFRHGRVLFAGDAAHQMSPFGARGGNSGIQDADNLAWKLALVVKGQAPERLLDSYDAERGYAADENLRITSATTDFLTPKSHASRVLRNAVLELASVAPFARALVNSGRLSQPTIHKNSPLSTETDFEGGLPCGAPCPNLALGGNEGYLLDHLGRGFHLLYFCGDGSEPPPSLEGPLLRLRARAPLPVQPLCIGASAANGNIERLADRDGAVHRAFAAKRGTCYLLRPDHHVAARWAEFDLPRVEAALNRALGKE